MTGRVWIRLPAMAIVAALALTGCSAIGTSGGTTKVGSAPYEQGSGTVASESRAAGPFRAVTAAQGVQVELTTGSPAVTVSADANLLAHVTTTVTDGTLAVDVAGSIETAHPLKVLVATGTTPERLSASTGATIDASALSGTALTVEASTGATVHATGGVTDLTVTAVGGGTADLRELAASRARVEVNTGSTVHVNASEAITGRCSLGSTLLVRGSGSTTGVTVDAASTLGHE